MGTDSVKLFNKSLSDRILAMRKSELIPYIEENLDALKQKENAGGFIHRSIPFELGERGSSVAQAFDRMIIDKESLPTLKRDLILDLAFGEEEIYLDYWGCYAEVFRDGDPKDSISSMKYFNDEEELYLFLLPSHVDQMIRSLKQHLDDLRLMGKEGIGRLEYFRDFCLNHSGYWIVYLFDF